MPSRLRRLQERTALDTFPPELSGEEVGAHDPVGPADRALVWTRRRPDNRAGLALQRCARRHLGFFPADLTGAPTLVLSWLAAQVGADPADGRRPRPLQDAVRPPGRGDNPRRLPAGRPGRPEAARGLAHRFGLRHRGLSSYTWTNDRWAQFATRVISSSIREATVVLDGILDHAVEFRPAQHATDTAGWTGVVVALFDLLGMPFARRLRDLADRKLSRLGDTSGCPNAGPLLTGRADLGLVARHWDDLARLAASRNQGWVTASLRVAKLQAQPRQNPVTRAWGEHGRAVRTLFLLRYLPDPVSRRETARQLTKGEAFHPLRQRILFGQHGRIRRGDPDAQADQATALHLVTAAVTCWNTGYLAEVVDQLRREGRPVTDEQLAHLSPTQWWHSNPYRDYRFHRTPPAGRRPLRRPPW